MIEKETSNTAISCEAVKESALTQQVHSAGGIRDQVQQLDARLSRILSRVRGSQPEGSSEDSQKNPPGGSIGELRDLHEWIAKGLGGCAKQMTALEEFI